MIPEYVRDKLKKYIQGKQIIESEDVVDGIVYVLSTPPHVQVKKLGHVSVFRDFFLISKVYILLTAI